MHTLQARFRDKASEILQDSSTITVAMGRGRLFNIETCYCVGTSDEIYCAVKPNLAIVEAIRTDAHVAFAVNKGFPNQMLQGTGRAIFLGGMDRHPQIREQILAKIPAAAMFLTTIRNLGVMKILPDQIAITDDSNLGLGPRPVYLPEAAQALPGRRLRWLQVMGIASWPLSLVPVLVATLLALYAPVQVTWWLAWPVIIAALLFHTGAILLAISKDFRRGVDRSRALSSSRVLSEGLLPVRHVLRTGLLCLAMGSLIGLFLVTLRGVPLLFLGLVGLLGVLVYAGWPARVPYRGVHEGIVSLGTGPLLVVGCYYVLTGAYHHTPLLVSLPIGFLAAAILHASHLPALCEEKAHTRTLVEMLGWEKSRRLYYLLIGLPYLLMLVGLLAGVLPGWAWLVFLSVPLAGRNAISVWRATPEQVQDLATLDEQTAYVHLAFGVLLMLALALGYGS
jgi:1,4-dihydroxy-2-naphthoate octaprenyltransferase